MISYAVRVSLCFILRFSASQGGFVKYLIAWQYSNYSGRFVYGDIFEFDAPIRTEEDLDTVKAAIADKYRDQAFDRMLLLSFSPFAS
jgi:hypothetical protein